VADTAELSSGAALVAEMTGNRVTLQRGTGGVNKRLGTPEPRTWQPVAPQAPIARNATAPSRRWRVRSRFYGVYGKAPIEPEFGASLACRCVRGLGNRARETEFQSLASTE
jgi:hypothetical protein